MAPQQRQCQWRWLALMAALGISAPRIASADCRLWHVEHADSALRVVSSTLAAGSAQSFILDGQKFASVVIVTGEGQSGDIIQVSPPIHIDARCAVDTLIVSVQRGSAASREVMRMSAAELRALRVTVNVTGGDGVSARFRIDRWEQGVRESLPVVDLLRGAVPLGPRDHSVTTIVTALADGNADAAPTTTGAATRTPSGPPLQATSGETAVRTDAGYPFVRATTPSPWRAVVDLAAASTIVRRGALPSGVTVREATMRQTSADGVRLLPLASEGAGGVVTGFRQATLPKLTLGSATFDAVDVLVLDSMPTIAGAPVDAIIGLDVLRRAGHIRFTRRDSVSATLTFGSATPARGAASATLALQSVGALNGVTARLGDAEGSADTFLVLDSGSPSTVISNATAAALHLALSPLPGPSPRGLDGTPLTMKQGRVASLELDALTLRNIPVRVADLPVLAKITAPRVGLLGFDVMRRFAAFEIDFTTEQVRIWR